MKYMLLVYLEEGALTEEERNACYLESAELCHRLAGTGQFVEASPLQSVTTATSLKLRDGKRLITDGPFAETREQLGGYFLVDANNLDEALRIAEQIPAARVGTIEVRPCIEIPALPEMYATNR